MALDDLGSGAFHPTTWPQLATCLRRLGGELCILMDNHDNLAAWVERRLGAVPDPVELALSPTDTRTYDRKDHDRLQHRVAELEGQVFQLSKRLNDSIDWRPDPGNFAQAALWNSGRVPNGLRPEDEAEPTGGVLDDLSSGALRVTRWAQLLDALQLVACNLVILMRDHDCNPGPIPPANQDDRDRVRGGPRARLWPSAHPGVISWRRAAPVASAAGASSRQGLRWLSRRSRTAEASRAVRSLRLAMGRPTTAEQ